MMKSEGVGLFVEGSGSPKDGTLKIHSLVETGGSYLSGWTGWCTTCDQSVLWASFKPTKRDIKPNGYFR